MHRVASVISTEFRAKYYVDLHPDSTAIWYHELTIWSPNINIFAIRAGDVARNLR
jgi:beta-glucosidase